jgi:hypothetical protein
MKLIKKYERLSLLSNICYPFNLSNRFLQVVKCHLIQKTTLKKVVKCHLIQKTTLKKVGKCDIFLYPILLFYLIRLNR